MSTLADFIDRLLQKYFKVKKYPKYLSGKRKELKYERHNDTNDKATC